MPDQSGPLDANRIADAADSVDAATPPDASVLPDLVALPDYTITQDLTVMNDLAPQFPPPLPEVITYGGPVLSTPRVHPIYFAGTPDPMANDVQTFLPELQSTGYWTQTTSEYGVGNLQILSALQLPGAAPATLDDATLQHLIGAQLSGSNPPWGANDTNAIYLLILPSTTTMTSSLGTSCNEFVGYHGEGVVPGGTRFVYAVACLCPGLYLPILSDLGQRTMVISHELVEAATDPYFMSDPAYQGEDDANVIWTLTLGGELGDMCEFNSDAYVIPQGGHYSVQRTWSNAAARQHHIPCVPATGSQPFFDVYPVLSQRTVTLNNSPFTVDTVDVPIGQTKVVDLKLYSATPTTGPWAVTVWDWEAYNNNAATTTLSLDKANGQTGDTLHLSITAKASDTKFPGEAVLILSDLNGQETWSIVYVTN